MEANGSGSDGWNENDRGQVLECPGAAVTEQELTTLLLDCLRDDLERVSAARVIRDFCAKLPC